MNSKRKILISIAFLICLFSCVSYKKITSEGQIIHKHRMYDTKNNETLIKYEEKDLRIWFKDSTVIYEINKLYVNTDSDNKETWYYKTDRYTYLDLKTMIFYDYLNFSDTAKLVRSYMLPTSKFVGWNFYTNHSLVPLTNILMPLSDTLIKHVDYKRLQGENKYKNDSGEEITSIFTYYMRCDKKAALFHIDKDFDDKINECPAVRFDYLITGKNQNTISSAFDYVADTLTIDEKKIFKQWGENAKQSKLPIEKLN